MRNIIRNIPNFITCCNLLCGCLAIVNMLDHALMYASYFILAGAVFDFFDGFVARLLKAYSSIGEELDSFADMVSFGLAPGIFVYILLADDFSGTAYDFVPYLAFLIPVFSAIRLAIYNNDKEQQKHFKGLPTPSNALFFVFIPFYEQALLQYDLGFFYNKWLLLFLVVVFSFLMVSGLSMFSLKIQSLRYRNDYFAVLLILSAVVLFIFINFAAFPVIIILYLILSLINNLLIKYQKNEIQGSD